MDLLENCKAGLVLLCIIILVSPAAAALDGAVNDTPGADSPGITLFIPSPNMIHSDQILDMISTPEGGVLFGTSFGLSAYNGTWSTRHINRDNISEGLMDEFITAVEYDSNGNLWTGYSGGIQIYDGQYYQTIRDQQLLKDPRIQDLQRWNDDIWIATGHSGIHRYRAGTWTWFQPMTRGGPGFYEISQMALDPADNILIMATADNGLWIVNSPDDPVGFEQIAPRDGTCRSPQQVRRDPYGGVYFFNETTITRFQKETGFITILSADDLTQKEISINDLAAATSDGTIYIATDDGIYLWRDGKVLRHISRFEGIGTSEIVRTIGIDARGRVWFSTRG